MKFRVLFIVALLVSTSLALAAPATVIFNYRGMGECDGGTPITGAPCWAGTPCVDGTGSFSVVVSGVPSTCPAAPTWVFNGVGVCGFSGYFFPDAYCTGHIDAVPAHVVATTSDGCVYTSNNFTLGAGANDFFMYESDWASCLCQPTETWDMGDLYTCDFPTLPMNPAHRVDTQIGWLGAGISAEGAPLQLNMDTFDDGVVFVEPFPWISCKTYHINVTVTAGPNYVEQEMFLNIWKNGNFIDGDRDFCDQFVCADMSVVDEWVVQDVPVHPGLYPFAIKDPAPQPIPGPPPWEGQWRARLTSAPVGKFGFGMDNQTACPGMCPGTFGADNYLGEVEDYIHEGGQLPVELTAAPTITAGDRQVTLSFTVADEHDVTLYEIMRDGAKVAELQIADGSYSYVDGNLSNGRVYKYSIVAIELGARHELSFNDQSVWSAAPSWLKGTVTEYALYQNYPNPFNPATEIVYDVLQATHVTLKVYNVMGQEVSTLVNGEMNSGRHTVTFSAANLTSGLYFYTVSMGDFSATKKMLLVQ